MTTLPNVPLPSGFNAYEWEPGRYLSADETRSWRSLDSAARRVTDSGTYVEVHATQYDDGSLDSLGIQVYTDDNDLNSDQARELASALLEAAAELDGWTK